MDGPFIDFGSLIPIVAILSSLGFAFIWLKHRQLTIDSQHRAGEADDVRAEKKRLEERVRVLERIVTDRGAQTAEQIEALRDERVR